MGTLHAERFAKCVALLDSPALGEATSALLRMRELATTAGLRVVDAIRTSMPQAEKYRLTTEGGSILQNQVVNLSNELTWKEKVHAEAWEKLRAEITALESEGWH